MQSAETVLDVIRKRGERRLPIERLYRQLFNPQLYLLAYGRIYANHGAMTPGVTSETVDGMSLEKIGAIIDALRTGGGSVGFHYETLTQVLADEQFALAVLNNSLCYIVARRERVRALRHTLRVLVPGGWVVMRNPALLLESPQGWRRWIRSPGCRSCTRFPRRWRPGCCSDANPRGRRCGCIPSVLRRASPGARVSPRTPSADR